MSLDFYCERLTPDFWAEPINAWSNLSFIIAGIWGFYISRGKAWGYPQLLSLLAILVGSGSFLFHTFANKMTHLFDLIPIFIFTLVFVYFSFRHKLKMSTRMSTLAGFLFVLFMVLIEIFVPKSFINGSSLYLLPLITLFFIGLKVDRFYLTIALTFLISLMARTFDNSLCEILPIGTHFIWHLLNGLCLAFMIRVSFKLKQFSKPA